MMEKFQYITIDGTQALKDCFEPGPLSRFGKGRLLICQNGECDVVIDMKRYHIVQGNITIVFPHSVVQVLHYSTDFGGYLLGADMDFFTSFQIPEKSSYYLYIKDNPCITPTEEEWNRIVSLHNFLLQESARRDHPMREEIDECLMRILAYEVAAIYVRRKPEKQQPSSRQEKIFQQFIYSLFKNFYLHRSLDYYAGEQSITPRHLSMVVKQISGQTAGCWVASCLIGNIHCSDCL